MNSIFLIDLCAHSFWMKSSIEFFNPPRDSIDVNLTGESILIVGFDIFFHLLMFQVSFHFISDPLQAILFQVFFHFCNFALQVLIFVL